MTDLVLAAPADLSPSTALSWARLVEDLHALGHASEVDLALLGDVLRAQDRLAIVAARLSQDGPVVTGSRGQVRPHPLLVIESRLRQEIASGFDRLGLSAARREWWATVDDSGRIQRMTH